MMQRDIKRLSLILLFAPFALWIMLLIILPHLGMFYISLREKVGPRMYEFGLENYINFFTEPIYWNTLIRTGSMSLAGHGAGAAAGLSDRLLHRQDRR
jgi:spermidine/putrescine transport system permease protein